MENALITLDAVQRDEQSMLNAIIESKGSNLPATISDLIPMLEFSKVKATAYKALCDSATRLQDQQELNQAALESGQRWATVHLYGQKRLGEITREVKGAGKDWRGKDENERVTLVPKYEQLSAQGIKREHVIAAEKIADNPEILDRVVEEVTARGEIPTKTAVLNEIRMEQARQSANHFQEIRTTNRINEIDRGAAEYFQAVKQFKEKLSFTIEAQKRKPIFASEAKNMMAGKHEMLIDLMQELEGLL